MTLSPAKCPNCGGELSLPKSKSTIVCMYCDSTITVKDAIDLKSKDIAPLLELMVNTYKSKSKFKEVIEHCNKILEADSSIPDVWFKKGLSEIYLFDVESGMNNVKKALDLNNSDEYKAVVYSELISLCQTAFHLVYNNWAIAGKHLDSMISRLQVDKYVLERLDNEYKNLTQRYLKVLDFAISLQPENPLAYKTGFRNLKKVNTNIWDDYNYIDRYEAKLLSLGVNPEAPKRKSSNGKCFIATAAMGSYDHPVVMDLRMFRDNWLLKRNWGVAFTEWYYIYGAKAAKYIEKSVILKKVAYIIIVKPLHFLTRKIK